MQQEEIIGGHNQNVLVYIKELNELSWEFISWGFFETYIYTSILFIILNLIMSGYNEYRIPEMMLTNQNQFIFHEKLELGMLVTFYTASMYAIISIIFIIIAIFSGLLFSEAVKKNFRCFLSQLVSGSIYRLLLISITAVFFTALYSKDVNQFNGLMFGIADAQKFFFISTIIGGFSIYNMVLNTKKKIMLTNRDSIRILPNFALLLIISGISIFILINITYMFVISDKTELFDHKKALAKILFNSGKSTLPEKEPNWYHFVKDTAGSWLERYVWQKKQSG